MDFSKYLHKYSPVSFHLHVFPAIFPRITFLAFLFASVKDNALLKWVKSIRKEFAPVGANPFF